MLPILNYEINILPELSNGDSRILHFSSMVLGGISIEAQPTERVIGI
jgi:hypothetical protein